MCDCYSTSFQSHFTFHRYIKSGCNIFGRVFVVETGLDPPFSRPVFHFVAKLSAPGFGLAFRGWSYTTTPITFNPAILPAIGDPNTLECLDTGCGVSLVDKTWLAKKYPSQKISTIPIPLKVRGIGVSSYELEKFALTALYMPGLDQGGLEVYTCIKCELHLVEGLRANMFIVNNVFCIEGFTINLASTSAHILSYKVTIVVNARSYS